MQKIAANCRCEGARGKTGKYFGFDIDGCSEVVHIFRVCSILVHLLILEFICQNKELCILLTELYSEDRQFVVPQFVVFLIYWPIFFDRIKKNVPQFVVFAEKA